MAVFLKCMEVKCSYCSKKTEKSTGHYNRATKLGAKLYCSQKCFGLDRRADESIEDKRRIKYFYDAFLHLADPEKKRKAAADYFKKDYAANPEKYKKWRRERQARHSEYCRQPEYKSYKHKYDVERHHKNMYGEFWEASILLNELEKNIDNREAKKSTGLICKSQKRKRQWRKIQAKSPLSSLLVI